MKRLRRIKYQASQAASAGGEVTAAPSAGGGSGDSADMANLTMQNNKLRDALKQLHSKAAQDTAAFERQRRDTEVELAALR
jgi:3-oxoacyl-ACP reductase-like protein